VEVEGNLGSGKSTVLRKLHESINHHEPGVCSVFGELINNDFLGAFYGNTKKYGFAFQMYMLTTRLYQIDEAARQAKDERKVAFLDRGAVGDTLFAILSHKLGNMDEQDMSVYKSVCKQRLPASLSDKVDVLLYLDVCPTECHRRITTVRNNEAEKGIPLEYLESVDLVYFELLLQWQGHKRGEYHEMNIGECPRMVFLRWNRFGKTEDVIAVLEEVAAQTRKFPVVAFSSSYSKMHLATEDDVKMAYQQLHQTDFIQHNASEPVLINWLLPHDNNFRRVVMFFLSIAAHIVMCE
jgi:deoxyadenosine/deoxycytidine kinase